MQFDEHAFAAEFMGSISKSTGYTEVVAEFEELGELTSAGHTTVDDRRAEFMTDAACEGLNAFLRYYKSFNLKHYVPTVTAHTVCLFGLLETFENRQTSPVLMPRLLEHQIPFHNTIG
ncbi:hypothetical protein [Hymenobacter sp. UYCo722]|uniref:hypothetical protein n=1 Tax=Hymenobacter sp. UYCo722 TaxID=3156335 RepID=UPI0033947D10